MDIPHHCWYPPAQTGYCRDQLRVMHQHHIGGRSHTGYQSACGEHCSQAPPAPGPWQIQATHPLRGFAPESTKRCRIGHLVPGRQERRDLSVADSGVLWIVHHCDN